MVSIFPNQLYAADIKIYTMVIFIKVAYKKPSSYNKRLSRENCEKRIIYRSIRLIYLSAETKMSLENEH